MANSLRFVVEVSADQGTGALNALSAAFNQAGISARTSLLGIGGASKEAGQHIEGFGSHVKDLKGEMSRSMQAANFFARSFNDLVPASSAAGEGIRIVTSALVGGFGLGLALEVVLGAVALFGEHLKESREEEKKAAEETKKHAEELHKLADEAERYRLRARGMTDSQVDMAMSSAEGRKELASSEQRWAQLSATIATLSDRYARLREKQEAGTLGNAGGEAERVRAEIRSKQQELAALESRIAGLKQTVGAHGEVFQAKTLDEERTARERAEKQAAEDRKSEREREQKAAFDHAKKTHDAALEGIRLRVDAEGKADDELTKDAEQAAKDEYEAWLDSYKKRQNAREEFDDWAAKEDAKRAREFESKFVRPVVSSFTRGLAQMAKGQASFADVVKGTWESILDMMLGALEQWLTEQITAALIGKAVKQTEAAAEISAEAGVAGAGAAAQAAPLLGPGAVGVGESVAAAVLASMLPFASARGGWDVPAGFNGLAMIHEREMVLPQREADAVRSGVGGSTLNVALSVVDSRGFERVMSDNRGPVLREQRKLMRRRRRG